MLNMRWAFGVLNLVVVIALSACGGSGEGATSASAQQPLEQISPSPEPRYFRVSERESYSVSEFEEVAEPFSWDEVLELGELYGKESQWVASYDYNEQGDIAGITNYRGAMDYEYIYTFDENGDPEQMQHKLWRRTQIDDSSDWESYLSEHIVEVWQQGLMVGNYDLLEAGEESESYALNLCEYNDAGLISTYNDIIYSYNADNRLQVREFSGQVEWTQMNHYYREWFEYDSQGLLDVWHGEMGDSETNLFASWQSFHHFDFDQGQILVMSYSPKDIEAGTISSVYINILQLEEVAECGTYTTAKENIFPDPLNYSCIIDRG